MPLQSSATTVLHLNHAEHNPEMPEQWIVKLDLHIRSTEPRWDLNLYG